MKAPSGLSRIFNVLQQEYSVMTAGISSPQSWAARDMTAAFAAAAVLGAATASVPLAALGVGGLAYGVKQVRDNGKAFLRPAS